MVKAIGIDLGGTWIRAALVNQDTHVNEILKKPTRRDRLPEAILEDIVSLIEQLQQEEGDNIAGIGLGVPTTFDANGYLDPCPNLPTMGKYPLKSALHSRLEIPIYMENDAQCFALGEWYYGAGKGAKVVAGITLGTGLGLGIVIDGKLFRGAHGRAGEIWCSPANIEDPEDRPRHIESFVSGTGIENAYEQKTGVRLSAEEIALQIEHDHEIARSVFKSFGTALRNVIFWIADMLDPDVVVLGGSVVKSSAYFYESILSAGIETRGTTVMRSTLGDLAAVYGTAMLVFSDQ